MDRRAAGETLHAGTVERADSRKVFIARGRAHRQNALILALDPAAFGDPVAFTSHVAQTLTALHGLPKADPEALRSLLR